MRTYHVGIAVVVVAVVIAAISWSDNTTNVQVPAGYAAYIVERPIFGRANYQGVVVGPSSTGRAWRLYGDLVSITPYSYSELFTGTESLIAKDKLPITGGAHLVFRIRSSEESIRDYMERYGGLDEAHTPDQIAKESYDNYIKEPFRTLIREEFAKYDGLSISDHLAEMGKNVNAELAERLAKTPFEVVQVVIGNAQPPAKVLEQVALKVAAAQELERKATEQQIADTTKNIEKANGEAAGERELAIAQKRADANRALSASLTPELLQYLAIDNLKSAEKVYLQLGANGLPLVGNVVEKATVAAPKQP